MRRGQRQLPPLPLLPWHLVGTRSAVRATWQGPLSDSRQEEPAPALLFPTSEPQPHRPADLHALAALGCEFAWGAILWVREVEAQESCSSRIFTPAWQTCREHSAIWLNLSHFRVASLLTSSAPRLTQQDFHCHFMTTWQMCRHFLG